MMPALLEPNSRRMKIEELTRLADDLKVYADKGAEIIAALKGCITGDFSKHIKIHETAPHSLLASFYGCQLLFQIELESRDDKIDAHLVALSWSYDTKRGESRFASYPFDADGHINQRHHIRDFSPHFLAEVFTNVTQANGLVLRP
jgi:hypothetical protein